MNMPIRKKFHNMSQGPPNLEFMQEKVQKRDFLKKNPARMEKIFLFENHMRTPGMVN